MAEWFGEAPANAKACDLTSEGFCETYHAGDEAYAEQIHYWTTPIEQCLDGRTDVTVHDVPGRGRRPGPRSRADAWRPPCRERSASHGAAPPPGCGWGCCWGRRCCGWACYLGSLAALFITSLWTVDGFTGNIERVWTLDNYRDLFTIDVYRTITIRTLLIAVAVTVIDALLALPDRALHGQGRLAPAPARCW